MYKVAKPLLRLAIVIAREAKEVEGNMRGVQTVILGDESRGLRRRKFAFYERQVETFIRAVEFIANDWMAHMTEVNSNLMLATGQEHHANE